MKQFFIISWLTLALNFFAVGQQKKIDSLMMVIEKDQGSVALYDLGNLYIKINKIEKAQELFENAIDKTIDNERKLGQVYCRIGQAYFKNGWSFEAEDYFLKSIGKAYASSDTATIKSASFNLGILYYNSNQYQRSIDLLEKIIPLAESNAELLKLYFNLGSIYSSMNKPYEAIGACYKSLKHLRAEPKIDKAAASFVYHNLGEAFVHLNLPDSALKYIHITFSVDTEIGDTVGLIYDYALLGHYNRSISKKREAIKNYNRALNLYKNYGFVDEGWDTGEYFGCLDSLAKTYKEERMMDSAFYILTVSKSHLKKIRDGENKKRMEKNYSSLEANIRKQILRKSETRSYEIQYYSIAVGLVLVSLIYLALSRFDKERKYSRYISIFILLLLFEFVLVWLDPYLSKLTGDVPLYKFLMNIMAAALIIPLHRGGEKLFNKVVLDIKFRNVGE